MTWYYCSNENPPKCVSYVEYYCSNKLQSIETLTDKWREQYSGWAEGCKAMGYNVSTKPEENGHGYFGENLYDLYYPENKGHRCCPGKDCQCKH